MKKFIFFFLYFFSIFSFSQQALEGSITHNNLEREYILYIPESYSGDNSVPLVLNLHGYTSNAGEQMIYSNFLEISDTEGFLLVHPMGTTNKLNQPFWNSWETEDVDDIGFLSSLIDFLGQEYNIDLNRVYSMGMSNGGFMSYTLACELSDKIAAIASVTGSMYTDQYLVCDCEHQMPVMQIHGTTDITVPYFGSPTAEAIDDVVAYWASFNQCNENPVFFDLPDLNTMDLCWVEHYIYENGTNGASVELYKVINGGHTWPGAYIPLPGVNTNQDFSASQKIWEFFAKYDINGLIDNTDLYEESNPKEIIFILDILGRKSIKKEGFNIEIYDDGSVEKKYVIE